MIVCSQLTYTTELKADWPQLNTRIVDDYYDQMLRSNNIHKEVKPTVQKWFFICEGKELKVEKFKDISWRK